MSQIEMLPRLRRPKSGRMFRNVRDRRFIGALVAGVILGMLAWAGFLGWLTYHGVRWAMRMGT